MKKSGKTQNRQKTQNPKKKSKINKHLDIDEEPEFSSENEYMNYVGLKNEMKKIFMKILMSLLLF